MGAWKGSILINGKEIEVCIDYVKPSSYRLGEWSGYGYLDEP